jgi:hypothetical protein
MSGLVNGCGQLTMTGIVYSVEAELTPRFPAGLITG